MSLLSDNAFVINLGNFSSILVTRKTGEQLRLEIEKKIELTTKKLIILDFSMVKIMDYSFADESIVKLLLRFISNEFDDKQLILTNLAADLSENVEVALNQRQVAVLTINNGTISFIGYLKEQLQKVLTIVLQEKELSARRLAELQGTTANVSNNRLAELTKMKLLKRKEQIVSGGGKQYVYSLPF